MGAFLLWLCLCLQGVAATHFAYGTMSWVTTSRNLQNEMGVKIFQHYAFRRNFALDNWQYSPTYRSTCPEKDDPNIAGCPLASLNLGQTFVIYRRTGPTTYASTTPVLSQTINQFLVMQESTEFLALSPTSDVNWIRGFYIRDWYVPSDISEYVVVYRNAARLSTLLNDNKDKNWLVSCNIRINDGGVMRTRSPQTTGSIREYLESCLESGFTVPRVTSDNRPVNTYPSLSVSPTSSCAASTTPGQHSGSIYVPVSCLVNRLPTLLCATAPNPPTTLGTDGKLTWYPRAPTQSQCSGSTTNTQCQRRYTTDNVGCFWDRFRNVCEKKDEYAIQFTLLEAAPTSLFTTYDVLFEVSRFCAQTDTTCNHAPHFSPRFTGPYYGTPNTPADATYHKNVCGNPNATSCLCLRGVEKLLYINAVDYDVTQTVTATYSLLPFAASISAPVNLGQFADPYDSNIPKAWTRYTLRWIPPLDGTDAAVCFQALDNEGKPSNGNYCLTLQIVESEFIYVSGIVRDFAATHVDFARVETTADNGAQWVQPVLSNGKPAKNATINTTTVTNFNQWFNTIPNVNKQIVFSTALVKLGTEDRFTYGNTNFLPINGILLGNDNTQGYPSRGAINTFFTYEMHTYLAYNATTNVNYTYGSTDDMWLFINGILVPGWTLHGIHPVKYQTIDLKKLFLEGNPLEFSVDTPLYRVDLFYAHRSQQRTEPVIQMELPKAVLCDALSSGITEMNFTFNGTYLAQNLTNIYIIGSSMNDTRGLSLLNQAQTASAVYMADGAMNPKPLKVLQGFRATFDFQILSPLTQGFAFVIASNPLVGNAHNQLGYGGMQKLIAIEFDTSSDPTLGDPSYQHVAVMAPALNATTGFSSLPMTANHQYALGSSIYSPSSPEFGPFLNMTNGTVHSVIITYAPPQQGDTSQFKTGWLRVWMGKVIKPVVEVPIPALFLANMLGSAAYVGFTTGAGSETVSKIFIKNADIVIVPPSPTNTIVLNWATSVIAGVVNSVMIQSRDSCGNNILVGADQARYEAEIRVASSGRLLTTDASITFTTNNDGTYNMIFSCTKAGQYVVSITFDKEPIVGSGATLIVNPASTSRTRSQFVFGTLPVVPSNALLETNGLYMIAVRRDGTILDRVQHSASGSIVAWLDSFPTNTIFGLATVGTFSASGLVSKMNSIGCTSFSSLTTYPQSSWACIAGGSNGVAQMIRDREPTEHISMNFENVFVVVAQSDITQGGGYLNVQQTMDTSRIFFASTAASVTTVSVIAMDQYGNINTNLVDQFAISFSPVMTNGNTPLNSVTGSVGYYTANLSTTSASPYTMSIVLVAEAGGGNIAGIPASLSFIAGMASHITSTASGIGLSNSQAGILTQFSVQLIDAFGNQIREALNAQKNSITVFFVSATNSSLIVNCTQVWSDAASELVVSYIPLVLGTYNLTLVINGGNSVFVSGRQMLVIPGGVSAPHCTYSDRSEAVARSRMGTSETISNVVAGVQTCIYVQSRDQFGNARDSPSDVFTFRMIGAVRNVVNSSYVGGGMYVHCFVPTLAPASLTVTIAYSGTFIGNPSLNRVLSVSVGSPSTLSFLPTTPISNVAGVPKPVLIGCIDSENNTILSCNPANFSFTLLTSAGIPATLNATSGPAGYVNLSTIATIAGAYTVQVRVNAQPIRFSPLAMTVSPGPTDGSSFGKSTPPSGVGAYGGVQTQNTSFLIQCKDQYGNLQNHANDAIIVRVNNGAIINPVSVPGQPGLWLVNYTVPEFQSFNISYSINGSPTYYANCFGALNTGECLLAWNETYVVRAGHALNLIIPYQLSSQIIYNNSVAFTNNSDVNSTIFQVTISNSSLVSAMEFTTIVDPSQRSPYRGTFSGLQYVGVYTLSASANRIIPCTPVTHISVIAGDIEPAATQFFGTPTQLIAGQNYSFQVRLRDRFGQIISDPANQLDLTLADVLGSHFPQFPSSFEGNNYTFIFSAKAAGSYNGWVNLTTTPFHKKLGQPPYFVVVAAAPHAPNSLSNLPLQQTAGTGVSFFVSLYDNTGNNASTSNPCINFNSSKWSLDVKVANAVPTALVVTPSLIDGRFYVTYTPIQAGTNVNVSITLLRDGVAVGQIPLSPVRVNAGPVAAPPSFVAQGGAVVAGAAATIFFHAFDVYNNPITQASLSAYLTGSDGVKFPDTVTENAGVYNITVPGTQTQRTGSYTWTIQVNSQGVNATILPLMIVPGVADWSQIVIPSLTGVTVGVATSTTVQLKDRYGNNVTQSSPEGTEVLFQQPAVFCSSLGGESPVSVLNISDGFSNVEITNLTMGRLRVSFTPLTRGLFRLDLLLNQAGVPCQDSAIFAVSAGAVSAPHSLLNITTSTTADPSNPKTARIVFLDAFGNNVDDFTCRFLESIYFGNQSYGDPVVSPSSEWIKPSWNVNCVLESGFFVYYITFQAPKSGNYSSVLVLYDSGAYNIIAQPYPLVVAPGVAVSFNVPTNSNGTLIGASSQPRATFPGQFRLTAFDAQNNQISNTGGHEFAVLCRLYSDSAVLYSFVPTMTPDVGFQLGTFFSTWAGLFQCEAKLSRSGAIVTTKTFPLRIAPAVCSQFQCPDGTCVGAYSNCSFTLPSCSGATPVQCSDGTCQASSVTCLCPSGTQRCAQGFCAIVGQCPPPVGTCSNRCPTGECPTTTVPCPSLTVCPPGHLICPDALTCVLTQAECPAPPNCSGTKKYACAHGDCVTSAADCPDRATCPTGSVLCFDGTCASSTTLCPSIYACPASASFRCPDGSCVPHQESCPSQTTCPPGFVMCWNRVCASSLSACNPVTTCPSGTLRCSTGDCAVNIYMCPSQPSCPTTASVLCPDGSCVSTVSQCSLAFGCPAGFLTCPTGSCISSANVSCPTRTKCSAETPVLCTDGRCVESASLCTNPPVCPVASPVRCPDGSCRGAGINCPTMITCPSERPVSCPDGYCAADISQCTPSANLTCPDGLERCFYGECVPYLSACPPHTTCPVGYQRCSDGTCRLACTGVIAVGQCPIGTVQCPQSNIGTACAPSLSKCPPGIVCPVSTPTRCFDGSCADSLANCVQGNNPIYNGGTAIPCPDGTWSPDGVCGTPLFCPIDQFLCSNYECKTVQTDCPVTATCASSEASKPLLCGTVCVADFSANDCTRTSTACSPATPFRCNDGVCRADPSLCVASPQSAASRCAPLDLCRDGTCSGACPSATTVCSSTSPSTPFACPDGMCTDVPEHCNKNNGCPYNFPLRCPNSGVCTNSLSTCLEIVCPANTWQSFGFCVSDEFQGKLLSNRCPTSHPFLCFDKTCVVSYSECTSPTWDTPAGVTPPNACPFSAPFRCSNGFCAVASNMCPTIPSDYCDGSTTGKTPCASGACVTSSIYCPLTRACLATEVRGVDGSCRSQSFVQDFGDLVVSSCRATYPFRCANGLCAKDANSCLDPVTMCPAQQPVRCPNGACVVDVSSCGASQAEPTGCDISSPIKCWNGECVNSSSACPTTDMCVGQPTFSRCPLSQKCVADLTTGCSNDAPVSCPTTSFSCGGCEASVNDCATVNGCPLSTPTRCASGACAAAGKCPPTVVCDVGQVVCADGSCQFALQACPPFPGCAAGTMLCPDKTCKQTCAQDVCPVSSPLKCQNAACTSNLKLCPGIVSFTNNPGVANGPDTYSPQCPDPNAPILCFDGRCRSAEGCDAFAKQVNGSTPGGASGLSGCASPQIICADGSCVTDPVSSSRPGVYCPIIPRCPANSYRCGDGSCRNASTPCPATSACPTGRMRCEDGRCRTACLAYDGCGLNAPFHCANRNCATSPEGCIAQSSSQGIAPITSVSRRLLQTNTTNAPPTWCSSNCISQIKAYQTTVTVNPSASTQVDLAVDESNNVVSSVLLPPGALLSTSDDAVTIEFRPVADSQLRNAENAVHPTRQTEFGAHLTYAETLLSVAFECVVPSAVVSPFSLNLTYSATIDFTRRPTTQYATNQNSGPDVCLAFLYRIPALRYSRWTCFPDGVVARHSTPPNIMPAGVQLNRVQGPIGDCGSDGKIYGFIHSPLRATNIEIASSEKTWAENNVLLVLVIFLAVAIVLILCIYCGFRLQRYRKKYKKEAEAVDRMQDEVDEMQQYGGTAGTKDDEVEMVPNIMVVQLQQVQDTLNAQNQEEKKKELEELRLESEERKKHLETLRADRDNLAQELAKLQADLSKQQNAPVARPVIEDFTPQDTAVPASPEATPTTLRAVTPATKTAFQSVRPNKKKDL